MEIKVNVPRPGLEPQEITINLPPRSKADKNNLLSLSDKDLAQMDPEKLEQVKKAKENLIEIMKVDREVQAMLSEEQFEALVSQKMEETDLSREDAELLVKRDQGLLGRSRPAFMPPAEDALTKAVKDAVAEQIKEKLFPKGDVENKGKGPDLAQTLKAAKDQGVQSLMLPDGSFINLNPKDTIGDELVQETIKWVKEKMPSMFKGEGEGDRGLSTDLLGSQNPEIVRLGLEFRAKQEETKAAELIAESKSNAMTAFATLAATLISPEGYAKVKGMIDLALSKGKGALGGGETPQDQPPPADDKFTTLNCLKCNHPNIVSKGAPKFTCEQCGEVNLQDW